MSECDHRYLENVLLLLTSMVRVLRKGQRLVAVAGCVQPVHMHLIVRMEISKCCVSTRVPGERCSSA